jgi:hypothetical protein
MAKTTPQAAEILGVNVQQMYSLMYFDVLPGKCYSPNILKKARSQYLFTIQDIITLAVARDLIQAGVPRRSAGQIASQAALMKPGEVFRYEIADTGIEIMIDPDFYRDKYQHHFDEPAAA